MTNKTAPKKPTNIRHKPQAKTASEPKAAEAAAAQPKTLESSSRPYMVESTVFTSDMSKALRAAEAEAATIDNDILAIKTLASNEITMLSEWFERETKNITTRAENEVRSREGRRADLEKVIAMAGSALASISPPTPKVATLSQPSGNLITKALHESAHGESGEQSIN